MYHLPVVHWESDSDDEEVVVERVPREGYRMFQRFNVDWITDDAFIYRFRLSKRSVLRVLQMIQPQLAFDNQRYSFTCSFIFHLFDVFTSAHLQVTLHFAPKFVVDRFAILCQRQLSSRRIRFYRLLPFHSVRDFAQSFGCDCTFAPAIHKHANHRK